MNQGEVKFYSNLSSSRVEDHLWVRKRKWCIYKQGVRWLNKAKGQLSLHIQVLLTHFRDDLGVVERRLHGTCRFDLAVVADRCGSTGDSGRNGYLQWNTRAIHGQALAGPGPGRWWRRQAVWTVAGMGPLTAVQRCTLLGGLGPASWATVDPGPIDGLGIVGDDQRKPTPGCWLVPMKWQWILFPRDSHGDGECLVEDGRRTIPMADLQNGATGWHFRCTFARVNRRYRRLFSRPLTKCPGVHWW